MTFPNGQARPRSDLLVVDDIIGVRQGTVVAVDCGYGAVKAGSNKRTDMIAFPAGACPAGQALDELTAEKTSIPLLINGDPWIAGFETAKLPAYERPIHRSYATTDHYRALLMEALYRVGEEKIKLLVLGLPTDLYLNEQDQIRHLKTFGGQYDVHGKRIAVDEVVVCNQPLGSATAFARRRGRIAIVDIGYRTTDTTVLVDGSVDPSGYSTCPIASRDVCEAVARSFHEETKMQISADMVDQQFRAGLMTIERRLVNHDLKPYLAKVAPGLAQSIWSSIQTTLRLSLGLVDQFLLTGGGAHLLRTQIEKLADGVPVTAPPDPAKANVEGYLQLGQTLLKKRTQEMRHG